MFKKHFEFCCGTCQGNSIDEKVADWLRLWLGASTWVQDKWNEEWLEKYINDEDSMFFLKLFFVALCLLSSIL